MPSRLLFDLGGQIPASGSLVVAGGAGQRQPASSLSMACVSMALSAGAGNWVIRIVRAERPEGGGGSLLGTGQGAALQAGPYFLEQGELLQIEVSGATSGASLAGSVYGIQRLNPKDLPPISAVPVVTSNVNATISGAVPVTTGQQLIDTATVSFGSPVTKNLSIPQGAHGVLVAVPNANVGVQVIGHITGVNYTMTPIDGNQLWFTLISAADTSIDITYTTVSGGPFTFRTTALIGPEATTILNTLKAQILDFGGQGIAVSNPLMVALNDQNMKHAYVEGGSGLNGTTFIAGVANQQIYVHDWELDTESVASFLALRDSSLAAPNGRFAVMNQIAAITGSGGGGPLSVGAGVVIDTGAGAPQFRISLWYRQF